MWRQPWVLYKIRCPICGNNVKGTFERVMLDVLSSDQRTRLHIAKPRHYICLRCHNEIYWRPTIEDVWDAQERI